MSITPQCLSHNVMSTPRFLCQQHWRLLAIGFQGIGGTDVVPVDDLRGSADDVVGIEALDDADETIEARQIDMVLAVPNGFAHVLGHLALFGRQLYLAEGVSTDGIKSICQLTIFLHALEEIHLLITPVTKAMKFHITETTFIHGLAKVFGKVGTPSLFVVTSQGIEFQTMHLTQTLHPIDIVIHHFV